MILQNQNLQSFINFNQSTALVEVIISIYSNALILIVPVINHFDVEKLIPLGSLHNQRVLRGHKSMSKYQIHQSRS